MKCFAILISAAFLLGCPSPLTSERRGIEFGTIGAQLDSCDIIQNGESVLKEFLVVSWNLTENDSWLKEQYLTECIQLMRIEGKEMLAEKTGRPHLDCEFCVILVFRDHPTLIGEYEYGLVVELSDIYSSRSIQELIAGGDSSENPVPLTQVRAWDFRWMKNQVISNYTGNCGGRGGEALERLGASMFIGCPARSQANFLSQLGVWCPATRTSYSVLLLDISLRCSAPEMQPSAGNDLRNDWSSYRVIAEPIVIVCTSNPHGEASSRECDDSG